MILPLIESPGILCLNETKIDEIKLSKGKIKEEFKDTYPYQFWNSSKPPKLGNYYRIYV